MNARIGQLSPGTFELLYGLALKHQTEVMAQVAYAKRSFGDAHAAVGVALDHLRPAQAAVAELENYGVPVAQVAA